MARRKAKTVKRLRGILPSGADLDHDLRSNTAVLPALAVRGPGTRRKRNSTEFQ
ncbi:MAG: hypothetical protein JW929_16615 [Anaerolineales bacterium]|nr:hypothetical protein [Anaerolineales bacterium]